MITTQRAPMRPASQPADSAHRRAEPGQRKGQRRHRAGAAEIGGDLFQGHHRDYRRAE
jgi:hypothetical protein